MAVEEEQRKAMMEAYESVASIEEEFFVFHQQTKVQFLIGQFQLFQSLATIILAFVAIMFVSNDRFLNNWMIASGVLSLMLLIYVTGFIRETLDEHDRALIDTDRMLDQEKRTLKKVIAESLKWNDFLHFQEYVQMQSALKRAKEELSFAGEIALFLFNCSLLSGLISMVKMSQFLQGVSDLLLVILIISLSIILSSTVWCTRFTKNISGLLSMKITSKK